ncbi:MAG: hypothetical protein QM820_42230 [Minicystis sp.]
MSLGEIVLLLLVGIIVVGPRNLPSMMRTAGQWVARLRRMTTDLRSQSGIDDILRNEGLDEHIHQLRSLSKLNVVESLIAPVAAPGAAPSSPYGAAPASGSTAPPLTAKQLAFQRKEPLREREYPLIGCDASGALPDDAMTYRMMAQDNKPATPAEPAKSEAETAAGEAAAEAKAEAPAETKADAPAEMKAEAQAETKAEASAETKAEASAETKADAPAETKADAQAETKAEAPAETKAEAAVEEKKADAAVEEKKAGAPAAAEGAAS